MREFIVKLHDYVPVYSYYPTYGSREWRIARIQTAKALKKVRRGL